MKGLLPPLLLLALFPFTVWSQCENCFKQPSIWQDVRYNVDDNTYYDGSGFKDDYWNFNSVKVDRNQEKRWLVFTKQNDVPVFSAPGNKGAEKVKLPFSQALWVFDAKEQWLQVGTTQDKPIGWVRKDGLILWMTPLIDHNTGLEIKAFAVNTTRASKRIHDKEEIKDRYSVFQVPQGGSKVSDEPLYEVLFIFQYAPGIDGVPGRYLVSQYYTLTTANKLLGWVNEDRLKLWSTSLCLEPNWDPAAMQERKEKEIYARIFNNASAADRDAYFSGSTRLTGLFANPRDPAFEDGGVDQRQRLDGFIFRYPVFSGHGTDGRTPPLNCVFQTGAPARLSAQYATVQKRDYSQDEYVRTQRAYEAIRKGHKNLNVILVVEGNNGVQQWVNPIIDALRKTYAEANNLSMGAVVYKNDDATRTDIKFLFSREIDYDIGGLKRWLADMDMSPTGDLVDTRPTYPAMYSAIEMAKPGQTNVLVHVASRPDHFESDINEGRPGFMDPGMLKTRLKDRDVHYLGYALPSEVQGQSLRTYDQMRMTTLNYLAGAMQENYQYLNTFLTDSVVASRPRSITEDDGRLVTYMAPATMEFRACLLPANASPGHFGQNVMADVRKCQEAYEKHLQVVEKILIDGSAVARQAQDLSTRASVFLIDRICEQASSSIAEKQSCLTYSFTNKVHYFLDASTAYRSPKLQYPVFKYVLFMPEATLVKQVENIDRLVETLNTNPTEARLSIQAYWMDVARSVLGKTDSRMRLGDLKKRMAGVNQMDVVLPFNTSGIANDLTIDDLDDAKKFTQDLVTKMTEQFGAQLAELRQVKGNDDIKYRVGGGDSFYWVPIEYLLK